MTADRSADLSAAIVIFLGNYPGKNDKEFDVLFGADVRLAVDAILEETLGIPIQWGTKSLVEIGDEVRTVMHERHPALSSAALKKLSNYFTYLVR